MPICTLNIGTLTGKTEELARMRTRYFGRPCTQYEVGIAISEGFRDVIKEFERFGDQLMKVSTISADCD